MDKILLIDTHNAIYRATVGFGPQRINIKHTPCVEGSVDCLLSEHQLSREHCVCGGNWSYLDNRCEHQPNPDHVVIFNFFRNLRPIIEMFSPDKCFFVLEGHPQFRYDLLAEYKANRIAKTAAKINTKEKVLRCKDEIVRLLKYLPVTLCRAAKYEADDVVATLCENMNGEELTVLSNDSDYIQLLQKGYDNCRVYNPIKKEFMQAPNYFYVAWKCLAGDKSDNIPSLLTPKKVEAAINDSEVFRKFMEVEENRANFNINRQLIEFRMVPEEEIILDEGNRDFNSLKKEFAAMKFESIIKDSSWEKYINTFNCLKF